MVQPQTLVLTGKERFLASDAIVVSKTDPGGRITYANRTFLDIAGYMESDVLGRPHNILRHPDMPRAVFKLLWDTIQGGSEIFAYVINRAKNGDHYWVFAHVTPTFGADNTIIGFHSSRRAPIRKAVQTVTEVYRELMQEESKFGNPKDAATAGLDMLNRKFIGAGGTYEDLVFSL
jgi:PAS domain S-box-containing protein